MSEITVKIKAVLDDETKEELRDFIKEVIKEEKEKQDKLIVDTIISKMKQFNSRAF